jgi:hypothetical protein
MSRVKCPNCHRDFTAVLSVNMFTLDANGKPQKGWFVCTECKEIVQPDMETKDRETKRAMALEACFHMARMIHAQKDVDDKLGTMTIDLDALQTWIRGMDEDLSNRVFKSRDPTVLRGALGYERWCTFTDPSSQLQRVTEERDRLFEPKPGIFSALVSSPTTN